MNTFLNIVLAMSASPQSILLHHTRKFHIPLITSHSLLTITHKWYKKTKNKCPEQYKISWFKIWMTWVQVNIFFGKYQYHNLCYITFGMCPYVVFMQLLHLLWCKYIIEGKLHVQINLEQMITLVLIQVIWQITLAGGYHTKQITQYIQ